MAQLPPLSSASELCNATSLVMNSVGYMDYKEPTVGDISEFDRLHGSEAMPDPLLTAHRMSRMYLVGAGDFVYSIGKMLALEQPMVVSPAVLARSAAEYASRCKYISSADDSPKVRLAKLATLLEEGYRDLGASKPDADPALVALARGLNDWKSTQSLPKVKLPNYTALVASLSPDMGKLEYDSLSGIAHASAISLTGVFLAAQMGDAKKQEDAWRHALFATQCGLLAAAHVCVIREGDKTEINHCLTLFYHWVREYNRYLRDLSSERGNVPPEPRP